MSDQSSTIGVVLFRLGELFCGPGGLAVGAMRATIGDPEWGIVHQWATDYDPDTVQTYRQNITPDAPESVILRDVRELPMQELAAHGQIDGLAFGFPCNDFSVVGEQRGLGGTYGPLYSYGVKALEFFKPLWFLAENVSGLQSANEGKALELILGEFEKTGYRLVTNLYKFEQYGVPQARHRVIIVGIREDVDVTYRVPSVAPYAQVDVSARTALSVPPITADMTGVERTRQSARVVERLTYIKPGQNAFTADMPEELRLNVRGAKISQIYKRLCPDKPAYTVTGSGGGGTHMYHWSEHRALTNRERARLQTFPDDFDFAGSKESVRKQIGMAVPARGAQIIFEAILRSFKGEPYPHQAPSMK